VPKRFSSRITCAIVALACWLFGCGRGAVPLATDSPAIRTYYVAPAGSNSNPGTLQRPFRTIQHALDVARRPGDVIKVRAGTYFEAIEFEADGTKANPIVLENYPGERPFISGKNRAAQRLVRIFDRSHVRFTGFEVGNLLATSPLQSGAIFVDGYGTDVQVVNNYVHDIVPLAHKYANGRAIQIRGYYEGRPLTDVVVARNTIERCTVQDGNILEISGNSSQIQVIRNHMAENRGIALNVTGGTRPPAYARWRLQVRDVLVAGNEIDTTNGSGAIGLYIQASRAVQARHNRVARSGFGLYVTSEYRGVHSQEITVADNVVIDNAEAGILIGSPFFTTTVLGATVEDNAVMHNGALESGNGGNFGIGRARQVRVHGNRFVASDPDVLIDLGAPYEDVKLDGNCYDDPGHSPGAARFGYAGTTYTGFSRYRDATRQDQSSTFGRSCD
jgi:hypothetical protein